jgi:hypothetical protein
MSRGFFLFLVLIAVLATAASAAAGSGRGSSVSLVILSSSTTTRTANPSIGDNVTFVVSTTATSTPWVEAQCFQSRRLVYSQIHGFFPSYFTDPIYHLGPTPSWSSGSTTCTATLFSYESARRKNLATTTFSVSS